MKELFRRRLVRGVTVLAALALCITACAPKPAGPVTPDADGLVTLRTLAYPILGFAPIWVGIEEGYFRDHGINLELGQSSATSSVDGAGLLVSGDFQLVLANPIDIVLANQQDFGLTLVAGNSEFSGPEDTTLMALTADDGPTRFADLGRAGAVVGVSAVGGPATVSVRAAIDADGGDSSLTTFQAVPMSNAGQLVANHSVVAVETVEPFVSLALSQLPVRPIGATSAALPIGAPSLAMAALGSFADANPEVMAELRAALDESIAWIDDPANADALAGLGAKYTGRDIDSLRAQVYPRFSATIDRQATEQYLDLYVKYGVFPEAPALDTLVSPDAQRG